MILTSSMRNIFYLDSEYIRKTEAEKIAENFYTFFLNTERGEVEYGKAKQDFWAGECSSIANSYNGVGVYNTISTIIGNDKDAGEYLRSIGYVGLRIHEQNGATGENFTNYLIFNTKDVKIIKKEPVGTSS